MPPRHGKSEAVSHWGCVWVEEEFPEKKILLGSYEAEFASGWSRKARDTILANERELLVRLSSGASAAHSWQTTKGGGMHTAGVGGPFTGRGGDLLIIDDPVKNSDEAFSPTFRKKTWEWFQSTAYTRLEPGGSVIVIMTRWHEDDLVGRLIAHEENGGEHWDVIKLPALAEANDLIGRPKGAALWPDRYNEQALARIKKTLGSWFFGALYQQDPKPRSTGLFARIWFDVVDAVPRLKKVVRYWDMAATEVGANEDPDWTAGVKLGESESGLIYVLDVKRIRGTPNDVEKFIRQTAMVDGKGVPVFLEQEGGSAGKTVVSFYRRLVLPGFEVRGIAPTGEKAVRAGPFSAKAEAGEVKLVKGPWVNDYLDELESFPAGAHDDQVDASSGAYDRLMSGGSDWTADQLEEAFGNNTPEDTASLLLRKIRGAIKQQR